MEMLNIHKFEMKNNVKIGDFLEKVMDKDRLFLKLKRYSSFFES